MNDYRALLDSTEEYLQALKNRGARHLTVRREILAALGQPVARTAAFSVSLAAPRTVPATATAPVQAEVFSAPPAPVATFVPAPMAAPQTVSVATVSATAPVTMATPQTKEEAMRDLHERAAVCVKCPNLARARKNVVFGVGDIHAPLMFVGEAPGADEDAQGEPFVGAAGQLLTKIIKTMGFSRETVYIANVLKCRPDTPGQTAGNRKPSLDEMKTCLPYLLAQIDVIAPRVIVALGATAIEGLLGKSEGITRLRGRFLEFRNIPLMPTFHPAYLLRNQAMSEKRKVWEDMLQVLECLGAPISEKQRGYFLSGQN